MGALRVRGKNLEVGRLLFINASHEGSGVLVLKCWVSARTHKCFGVGSRRDREPYMGGRVAHFLELKETSLQTRYPQGPKFQSKRHQDPQALKP